MNIEKLKIGGGELFIDDVSVGETTQEGIIITYEPDVHEFKTGQYGSTSSKASIIGAKLSIKIVMAENTAENLKEVLAGTSQSDDKNKIGSIAGEKISEKEIKLVPFDGSDSWTFQKAVPISPVEILYQPNNERVYSVTFLCLVDEQVDEDENLAHIGEPIDSPTIDSVAGRTSPAILDETTPDVIISDVESGDLVEVYDDTTLVGSGTAISDVITITLDELSVGLHTLKAKITRGEKTSESEEFLYTVGVYSEDVTGSGTASASGTSTGLPSWIFDNNFSTSWYKWSANNNDNWIKYDFGEGLEKTIAKFTVRGQTGVANLMFHNMYFEGSNDGLNWTTIYTKIEEDFPTVVFEDGITYSYEFPNTTAYRYYRLRGNTTTMNGIDDEWLAYYSEMEMMEIS
jgi:hypothetical protein